MVRLGAQFELEGEPKLADVRGKIVGIVVRVLPAKQKISVVGLESFENAEVLLGAVVGVAFLGIRNQRTDDAERATDVHGRLGDSGRFRMTPRAWAHFSLVHRR